MTAERWPNSLGWNVKTNDGKLRFEIWPAGSVVRMKDDPDSLCGSMATHYIELPQSTVYLNSPEEAVSLCQWLWTGCWSQWTKIEIGAEA